MNPSGETLQRAAEQPYGIEVRTADGVFVKQMAIPRAGTIVPQHAHAYDHLSMLARGSVRVWADDVLLGDRHAPCPIHVPANVKHRFMSLEDATVIFCIHNVARFGLLGEVAIAAEHHLDLGPCDTCEARSVCEGK